MIPVLTGIGFVGHGSDGLARIVHHQWIMRDVLMACLDKPVHAKKHPDFGFQI